MIAAIVLHLLYASALIDAYQPDTGLEQIFGWKNEGNMRASTFAFASYYQNNMVLQREPQHAIIWGYGIAGATVNISVNVQDVYSTTVRKGFDGKQGVWSVTIKPQPAGKTTEIQGVHDDHGLLQWILLKNVIFGDVWVCSGQSNMQMTVSSVFNATEELAKTSDYPNIRLFTASRVESDTPLYDIQSIEEVWSIPSPKTVGGPMWSYFSAVCWFYGRGLYDNLHVPIGLISSSWGGTRIEVWSPPAALSECGVKNSTFSQSLSAVPVKNSVLWNAMIHPLLNMTIKGVVWYQGESNAVFNRDLYSCTFPAMIKNWRKSWFQGTGAQTDPDFPFGFVQIGPDSSKLGSYPEIRWHQTADVGYVPNSKMPNTFMAVAADLRDDDSPYGSVHIRDKQDVGIRLVAGGLSIAYGQTGVYDGPFPENLTETREHDVFIEYSKYQDLAVNDEGNFQVCCQTSSCNIKDNENNTDWSVAHIVAYTAHTIIVSGEKCSKAFEYVKKVRYAWAFEPCEFKQCSVYNTLGFPAPPFILDVQRK